MLLGYEYDILIAPVTTEKTTKLKEQNKYCFSVAKSATKEDIKKSIETIFDVEVEDVNIINTHGKVKKFKGRIGKRSDVKKAIVSIKNGQEMNFAKLG